MRITVLTSLMLVASAASADCASASDAAWTAGGTTPNWSDPKNWSPVGVPPDGSTLSFSGGPGHAVQDLDTPPLIRLMQFSNPFQITGNPIRLPDLSIISATVPNGSGGVRIDSQLQIRGQVSVGGGSFAHANGLRLGNLTGSGGLTVMSDTAVGQANYTGPTQVQAGANLYVGASQVGLHGITTGQGDYTVNGTLSGDGVIGLAPGARVVIAGSLFPVMGVSIEPDPSVLTINGTLAFASGGQYEATGPFFGGPILIPGTNVIVNGLLDLSAAGEQLFYSGAISYPQVVMSYQLRVGEFDRYFGPAGTSIVYTSAPGGGPGDVVIVPAPSVTRFWPIPFLLICRTRRALPV